MPSQRIRAGAVRLTAAVVLAAQLPVAVAQTSRADLADLVRRQAAQIEKLEQRVDALERRDRQADAGAAVQPDSGETAAAPQADTDPRSVADLQDEVDELKERTVQVDWSSGSPKFTSADDEFTFQPLGRIQYDFGTTSGSSYDGAGVGDRNISGTEFRRLRLGVQGQLTDPILYKLELDFANSDIGVRDAYIATQKDFALGQGVVYLGNKFADRSLDGRTSSKYIWFLDRNAVADAISPESGYYNMGTSAEFYGDDDWHLSLGVSKGSLGGSDNDSDNLTVLSRGHFNPLVTDNSMLHVGAWGFYEDFSRGKQPELTDNLRFASHFNDNVRVYGDTVEQPETSTGYGFELAGLTGPVAASAEYGRREIDSRVAADTDYDAYSAQIGYSLTGEAFGYSTKNGVWSAPDIADPVTDGGWGAWQVMARYDALDYENSGNYAGGTGHGTTLGLSWYLNNYTRFMLNWINWDTHNRVPIVGDPGDREFIGSDDGNTVSARAQVIF